MQSSKRQKQAKSTPLRGRPSGRFPRKRNNPGNRARIGASNGSVQPRSMPQAVSVGTIIPQSYFGRSQERAQQNTDIGGMHDSVRVCGCDLFTTQIKAGSGTATAGFGLTANYYAYLTPGTISPRVQQEEELWQYYAIRKIQIMSTPEVGTSTAVSAAVAVIQSADESGIISAPSQQQLLEVTPSMKFPVYQTASMEYTHNGTKLWLTSTENSETPAQTFQCVLACALAGTPVASTVYATLWMKYEIDFYKPSFVLGNPSYLRLKADRLEDAMHDEKRCTQCKRCSGERTIAAPRRLLFPRVTKPEWEEKNSQSLDERKLSSATEPDSPILVSGLSTPGRQQDHPGQPVAAVRSAHGARSSSTKGAY